MENIIIAYLLYKSAGLERQLVVVVDIRICFLRELDSTRAADVIDAPFLKNFMEYVTLFLPASCPNLPTFV